MWYEKGLNFKCNGCSKCCTGAPGAVWLEKKDLKSISLCLKISEEEFIKNYVRQIGNRLSLKETYPNYDCIFLRDKKCHIYAARPLQCRIYPFWQTNLKSIERWSEESNRCIGITPSAPLISFREIQKRLKEEREANYELELLR